MGQHINKVTYYTANGIYKIPVGGDEGLYVPVKFDTSAVAVADAELKDGETSVANHNFRSDSFRKDLTQNTR